MEQTIKQSHVDIHTFLVANPGAKIGDVMDKLTGFCVSRRGQGGSSGSAVRAMTNDGSEGETLAVRTAISGRWLPVVGSQAVNIAPKKASSTGYSAYSQEGTKFYNARKKVVDDAKAKNEALSARRLNDEISVDEYKSSLIDLTNLKAEGYEGAALTEGFATREEVIDYLQNEGYNAQ